MMPKPKSAVRAPTDEARSLPALCMEATHRLIRAERALEHLNEAIDCLKRLLAKGWASQEPALSRLST